MSLYIWTVPAAGLAVLLLLRKNQEVLPLFGILTFVLPFAVGGFHGYAAAAGSLVLLAALLHRCRKNGGLMIRMDPTMAALGAVLLSVCLSPLWAADRGMAIFGLLHWLPVALYRLYLGQCSQDQQRHALDLLPLCGAVMTAVSVLSLLVPGFRQQLAVNGRLAGFFQYPNTFAAFLLAGYILCAGGKEQKNTDFPVLVLLAWGVVLSGSRTAFLLLVAASAGTIFLRKNWQCTSMVVLSLVAGILLGNAAAAFGIMEQADRYQELGNGGTFFARLLYWQDAMPLIGGNPLGIGYWGWRSLQGSVQTGRYFTSYLHNGLLQLALDAGWLPAALMAFALLRGLFAKGLPPEKRMLLMLLLAYCIADFHTEYLTIWVILLSVIPMPPGKQIFLTKKPVLKIACALAGAVCLWLGTAEALYYSGNVDACLVLTPFHTDALEAKLSMSETDRQPELAERLLRLDAHRSRAWNAKAYAALDQGDWERMMAYKEEAIRCDRYQTAQYLDYIQCLYTAMQTCLQAGDSGSAWTCAKKILAVREMMETVNRDTSTLASATGEDNMLILPEDYQVLMTDLEAVMDPDT